ncbi:hypothetical protein ACFL29_01985 [Patescibacteria group bacterium]
MIKRIKEFLKIWHLINNEKLVDTLCKTLMCTMEIAVANIRIGRGLSLRTEVSLSDELMEAEIELRRMQDIFKIFARYTSISFKNRYSLENFRIVELPPPECMTRASRELDMEVAELKKGAKAQQGDSGEEKQEQEGGEVIRPNFGQKEGEE